VLNTLVPTEVEVESADCRWYLQRIRPYRTLENVIEGAVITYTEITEVKKAKDLLRESDALRRLGALVRDAHDAMIMLDLQGTITAWNPGAVRLYGWCEDEALTMSYTSMVPESQRRTVLAEIRGLASDEKLETLDAQRQIKCGDTVRISMTATLMVDDAGVAYAISLIERLLPQQPDEVKQ
jgi:two-component system CheB/CheR fusion protein